MKHVAPYRLFFPVGVLSAVLAVGVWLVQDLGWFESPALFIHSKLIVGGFLWSFIIGFLMTAVPRMTGTPGANRFEDALAGLLLAGQVIFAFRIDGRFFYANQMLLILFVAVFAGRRIVKRTKPLPVFFPHVGVAMVLAFLGSFAHFRGDLFLGFHLYHLGSVLVLILGLGTRFFSFLSGLPSIFETGGSPAMRWMFHGLAVLTGVLVGLAGAGSAPAYLAIAIVALIYLFGVWKVQRPSSRPSALKWGVRIVAASVPASFLMTWLQPAAYLAWFHLLFIGCFALITFSVATRVTLAHGSYSMELEMKARALWWFIAFLILATVARLAYGLSAGPMKPHWLHLAATFWILAVAAWGWEFVPKMFKTGPQAKPSC